VILDQLRALRDAKPFIPFVITMTEGSRYLIGERADMILTTDGVIALRGQEGTLRILNHIQVSEAAIVRGTPVAAPADAA